MDNNRTLLLWVAAGSGVVLLYSAYKGKSPTGVITAYANADQSATPKPTSTTAPITSTVGSADSSVTPFGLGSFVTDANGNIANVPPAYASNPDLYIPSRTVGL